MDISKKLKKRRKELSLTMLEVAKKVGVSEATVSRWESGDIANMRRDKIALLANALQVTPAYIMGWDEKENEKSNVSMMDSSKIKMIPLYESVSAGFGTMADDYIIDYIPCYIDNILEADEYLCIRVKGDSMYPKIEDGDIIQVHMQSSVDSGSIAVILNGDESYVKRVIYDDNSVELHSINPMYPPIRFEGSELLNLRIVGLVKKIIKEV